MKHLLIAGIILFLFLISLNGWTQPRSLPLILDMVHDNPGEGPYESQFNQPEVLEKMGYNGKVFSLFKSAQLAVDWSDVNPDILPVGSPDRQWVDKKATQLDSLYSEVKNAGLHVYCMSDLILFPKRLVEKYQLLDVMGDPTNPNENFLT